MTPEFLWRLCVQAGEVISKDVLSGSAALPVPSAQDNPA